LILDKYADISVFLKKGRKGYFFTDFLNSYRKANTFVKILKIKGT